MKKIKFLIPISLALLLGMTSCNSETATDDTKEGTNTFMTVSLDFPSSDQNKAITDPNSTVAEAKINTIDVFVFSNTGNFQTYKRLQMTDFVDGGNDKYVSTTPVATTTGPKNVYVGLNLPSGVVTAIQNGTEAALGAIAQTMLRGDMTSTATTGIPMFSKSVVSKNLVVSNDGSLNKFDITVQRMVAKVVVEHVAALPQVGTPGSSVAGKMSFAVNNFNHKMFMMQDITDKKDPNWNIGSYLAADFSKAGLVTLANGDYTSVWDRTAGARTPNATTNIRYSSENSSNGKTRGEITRITVAAVFMPNEYKNWDGTNLTVDPTAPNAAGQDYWMVVTGAGTREFFLVEAEATAFATAKTLPTPLKYTKGYNYWHIYLNKDGKYGGDSGVATATYKWDVFRNDVYNCNITKVTVPGRHTPDIEAPEITLPPADDTNLQVDINIQKWNTPIISDHELVP